MHVLKATLIWVFDEYDESCGPGFDFIPDLWTPDNILSSVR
jgi:hypothetical protein